MEHGGCGFASTSGDTCTVPLVWVGKVLWDSVLGWDWEHATQRILPWAELRLEERDRTKVLGTADLWLLDVQGPVPRALLCSSSSHDCLSFGFQVTASFKTLTYSWDVLSAVQIENPWLKGGPHSHHQALTASPAVPRYPCNIGRLQRLVILLVL